MHCTLSIRLAQKTITPSLITYRCWFPNQKVSAPALLCLPLAIAMFSRSKMQMDRTQQTSRPPPRRRRTLPDSPTPSSSASSHLSQIPAPASRLLTHARCSAKHSAIGGPLIARYDRRAGGSHRAVSPIRVRQSFDRRAVIRIGSRRSWSAGAERRLWCFGEGSSSVSCWRGCLLLRECIPGAGCASFHWRGDTRTVGCGRHGSRASYSCRSSRLVWDCRSLIEWHIRDERMCESVRRLEPAIGIPTQAARDEVQERLVVRLESLLQSLRARPSPSPLRRDSNSRLTYRVKEQLLPRAPLHQMPVGRSKDLHDTRQLLLLVLTRENRIPGPELREDTAKRPHIDAQAIGAP